MQPSIRKETAIERAALRQQAFLRTLLDDGGWVECAYCSYAVMADDEDIDMGAVIFDGCQVFCGPRCKAALERRMAEQENRAGGFALEVCGKRPD